MRNTSDSIVRKSRLRNPCIGFLSARIGKYLGMWPVIAHRHRNMHRDHSAMGLDSKICQGPCNNPSIENGTASKRCKTCSTRSYENLDCEIDVLSSAIAIQLGQPRSQNFSTPRYLPMRPGGDVHRVHSAVGLDSKFVSMGQFQSAEYFSISHRFHIVAVRGVGSVLFSQSCPKDRLFLWPVDNYFVRRHPQNSRCLLTMPNPALTAPNSDQTARNSRKPKRAWKTQQIWDHDCWLFRRPGELRSRRALEKVCSLTISPDRQRNENRSICTDHATRG